jgi:hypothetical protein
MHGFYKANGGCGYVKKPDFLMRTEPEVLFDPREPRPVKKTLKVKVYMGDGWRMDFKQTHFDQYSPPDFYARVCRTELTRIRSGNHLAALSHPLPDWLVWYGMVW